MAKGIVVPCEMPTSPSFNDITGQTINGIKCLRFAGRLGTKIAWEFQCKCGKTFATQAYCVRNGLSKSCGCAQAERAREMAPRALLKSIESVRTHGMSKSSIYNTYLLMLRRCNNPKSRSYENYGGRGIKVCERWVESFENFYADMGEAPSEKHSLDREDNDGPYCKSNCTWSTAKEQSNNRRCNILVTINGQTKTLSEWFDGSLNEAYSRAKRRIYRGWCGECAVTKPNGSKCVHRHNSTT